MMAKKPISRLTSANALIAERMNPSGTASPPPRRSRVPVTGAPEPGDAHGAGLLRARDVQRPARAGRPRGVTTTCWPSREAEPLGVGVGEHDLVRAAGSAGARRARRRGPRSAGGTATICSASPASAARASAARGALARRRRVPARPGAAAATVVSQPREARRLGGGERGGGSRRRASGSGASSWRPSSPRNDSSGITPAGRRQRRAQALDAALEVRGRALPSRASPSRAGSRAPRASPRSGTSDDDDDRLGALQRRRASGSASGPRDDGIGVAEQTSMRSSPRSARSSTSAGSARKPRGAHAELVRRLGQRQDAAGLAGEAAARGERRDERRAATGSVTSSTGRSAAASALDERVGAARRPRPGAHAMRSAASRSSCVPPAPARISCAPRRTALRMRSSSTPARSRGSRSPAIDDHVGARRGRRSCAR